jgi:hypothetical protein
LTWYLPPINGRLLLVAPSSSATASPASGADRSGRPGPDTVRTYPRLALRRASGRLSPSQRDCRLGRPPSRRWTARRLLLRPGRTGVRGGRSGALGPRPFRASSRLGEDDRFQRRPLKKSDAPPGGRQPAVVRRSKGFGQLAATFLTSGFGSPAGFSVVSARSGTVGGDRPRVQLGVRALVAKRLLGGGAVAQPNVTRR